MRFKRSKHHDDPEINLIPFIDILLVIIIFLMMTTTYSKFSALEINLPTVDDAEKQAAHSMEINVAVTADGQILINQTPLTATDIRSISDMLRRAAGDEKDPVIIINGDAKTALQSVVDVMQASQMAGYPHISFAVQTTP